MNCFKKACLGIDFNPSLSTIHVQFCLEFEPGFRSSKTVFASALPKGSLRFPNPSLAIRHHGEHPSHSFSYKDSPQKITLYYVILLINLLNKRKEENFMQPVIPKSPNIPDLTDYQIAFLTSTVFGPKKQVKKCDALFIFGGTHPGHWEKSLAAYKETDVQQIIVTGGHTLTGKKHPEWNFGTKTEADVIREYLVKNGVPPQLIVAERRSTNTLENVTFSLELVDFSKIKSLMFVCKSHATGRQLRTLTKYFPPHIDYLPYTFDAIYSEKRVSRDEWMHSAIGRARVWGEYLRILHYGAKGDISTFNLAD